MSEHNTDPQAARRRIQAAQAARPPVDNNGRPTHKPANYTYDERGLLVSAKPSDDDSE